MSRSPSLIADTLEGARLLGSKTIVSPDSLSRQAASIKPLRSFSPLISARSFSPLDQRQRLPYWHFAGTSDLLLLPDATQSQNTVSDYLSAGFVWHSRVY